MTIHIFFTVFAGLLHTFGIRKDGGSLSLRGGVADEATQCLCCLTAGLPRQPSVLHNDRGKCSATKNHHVFANAARHEAIQQALSNSPLATVKFFDNLPAIILKGLIHHGAIAPRDDGDAVKITKPSLRTPPGMKQPSKRCQTAPSATVKFFDNFLTIMS
ncbi:hypothetical protein [uncultured Nitrosomonas sp.]|uniref:hypothetical protein n=1 Tax=uncultured Nitrosomonas sp. TaxID=156424 RepID=UPI0026353EC6|nr:hypothetical protein [uncultured Nitrosomonas sp.]